MASQAAKIALDTDDAYSRDFYSTRAWRGVAQACLDAGYTAAATDAILRSKHTRWFRDGIVGRPTAAKFKVYLADAAEDINRMLVAECGMTAEKTATEYLLRKNADELFRRKHKIDAQLRNLGLLS